ncbi:DUF1949 domain-containing protein [Mycetocola reblochoni]|uniref:DUF1949 domain-containing protein n=1 Tax=Mycetocola reblochoni TaxID=331618 RepID=A0A3L6ZJY3_9MICO|nr:YigZ family protein [Mycetocola reblochoni]RLP67841.1 DUF1949 domain-containing protein [Mycetocola reblochoni]
MEVKRSLFRCDLVPVATEDAARSLIAAVRAEHPRARHHCSAFVLGPSARTQRSNDDGEPSGTAGAPMLDALTSAGLSDVVAVVTRYFGGVLLGAGGLTRAYRGAVAEAIAVARPRTLVLRRLLEVRLDYAAAASLEAQARRRGWAVLDADYAADVGLRLGVPQSEEPELGALVAELTAGSAVVTRGALDYLAEE